MSGHNAKPDWFEPELATLTRDRFSDPAWIYERKLDGERCLAFRDGDELRLMTRNRKIVSSTYPELVEAFMAQKADDFVLDGEVVAFSDGQTRFAQLQQRMQVARPSAELLRTVPVQYYLFDVLWADGTDLRPQPLRERNQRLHQLLDFADPLRYTEHRVGDGVEFYAEACQSGLGRAHRQAGQCPVRGRPDQGLAEVQVREQPGVRDRRVHRPAGQPDRVRRAAARRLRQRRAAGLRGQGGDRVQRADPAPAARRAVRAGAGPQPVRPGQPAPQAGVHWVKPRLVGQVGFSEWTTAGELRHPRFQGLRRDKSPADVIREVPQEVASTTAREQVKVGRLTVALSNTGKVLFPGDGITKGDLIGYYQAAAERDAAVPA